MQLKKEGFSWTVWVKAKQPLGHIAPIFETRNGATETPHLWFFPSSNADQVILNLRPPNHVSTLLRNEFITRVNSTHRDQWRHIAAVYDYVNGGRVYLNGLLWPIAVEVMTTTGIGDATSLHLGYRPGAEIHTFEGAFACAMVFEKALSEEEVKQVMDACP